MRLVIDHMIEARGHHRFSIDPAAANERADPRLRGGRLPPRRRDAPLRARADGTWRDGLLMDLLAEEYRAL